MRKLCTFFAAAVFFGCISGCSSGDDKLSYHSQPGKSPNIIFILTDDQRWDALGYAGNSLIQTPHMDELAESGFYFENAFVTSR